LCSFSRERKRTRIREGIRTIHNGANEGTKTTRTGVQDSPNVGLNQFGGFAQQSNKTIWWWKMGDKREKSKEGEREKDIF